VEKLYLEEEIRTEFISRRVWESASLKRTLTPPHSQGS